MMNFPVDEMPTLIISLLCILGKSSASATTNAGAWTSFFLEILKTRMELSLDSEAINALKRNDMKCW